MYLKVRRAASSNQLNPPSSTSYCLTCFVPVVICLIVVCKYTKEGFSFFLIRRLIPFAYSSVFSPMMALVCMQPIPIVGSVPILQDSSISLPLIRVYPRTKNNSVFRFSARIWSSRTKLDSVVMLSYYPSTCVREKSYILIFYIKIIIFECI